MREVISPGDFIKTLSGEFALVLSAHENDYGIFYNVMLSDGTSAVLDSCSVKLSPES